MATELSLFASLHRWARGQDENFCTEGLIHLLRRYLEESPVKAMVIVRYLTSGLIGGSGERPETVTIHGQVVSDGKRPDIEIACGSALAWVEVKVDAPVGKNQLQNYKTIIPQRSSRYVVNLLWRGGEPLGDQNSPDNYLLWMDLAELLRRVASELNGLSARILTEDYLRFLRLRSLAMSPVSSSIVKSLVDVESLIRLVQETTGRKSIAWTSDHFLGCPVKVADVRVGWLGFNFTDPQWLFFTTDGHDPNRQVNLNAARELAEQNIGGVIGKHWCLSVDLAEEKDFYLGDASAQVKWLRERLLVPATQHAARVLGLSG
jgi:hypothetical protein